MPGKILSIQQISDSRSVRPGFTLYGSNNAPAVSFTFNDDTTAKLAAAKMEEIIRVAVNITKL